MISYEDFKKEVTKNFLSYLPEEYQNMQVIVRSTKKINRTLDALSLDAGDTLLKQRICPTLYIEDLYRNYMENPNMHDILKAAAKRMDNAYKGMPYFPSPDIENAEKNIVFQLINSEQNKDMLKNLPHREFYDLSIIYRWIVDINDTNVASAIVNNVLADKIGMSEEQLFQAAMNNTKNILPPEMQSMKKILGDNLLARGIPEEEVNNIINGGQPEMPEMWIITNNKGINGAASILYDEILQQAAERMNDDLYLLPASIHDCIAMPARGIDPNSLSEMVYSVNVMEVDVGERLSNNVYYYDKDMRKLSQATDNTNISLAQEKIKFMYDNPSL